jgi:hypothetical protein
MSTLIDVGRIIMIDGTCQRVIDLVTSIVFSEVGK